MPQSYQLFIHLSRPRHIKIGALGTHHFPAGNYIYTGSAKRNIDARVARHQRKEKTLRWHIDYLLNDPHCRIVSVELSDTAECSLNKAVDGKVVVARFGASDCREGCGGHLKLVGVMESGGPE